MEITKNKPKRKRNRLEAFDYSSYGVYFITIHTKTKENHFWENINKEYNSLDAVELSSDGKIVADAIEHIPDIYSMISIDSYVVMPDHVHILMIIRQDDTNDINNPPTISNIVNQFKGQVTKKLKKSVWQKSFYDHIIRGKKEYETCVGYIYDNPVRWYMKYIAE